MPFSEETPLLHDNGTHEYGRIKNHDLIYERFSPRQKRALVAIVSWCGLMPLFVSATIYPSIPQMVSDFNSTPQIIGLTVSISILAMSIGSIGVSVSRSVWELFFYRVFQAAGASPGFSIGAGVIGDIYKLEERGTAIGIFLAIVMADHSVR
ncbi:hypothetical protein Ac2012v2_001259 [Leucoagaricus gongylophorus]